MYSLAVVSAREYRKCDWMSFTEPRLCALVAIVRWITWKFSFGIPSESASGFETRAATAFPGGSPYGKLNAPAMRS